jgi:hypothetical protein
MGQAMRNKFPISAFLSGVMATPLFAAPPTRPTEVVVPAPSAQAVADALRFEDLRLLAAGPVTDAYGMQALQRQMAADAQARIAAAFARSRGWAGAYGPVYAAQFAPARTEKAPFLGVTTSPVTPILREQLGLPRGTALVIDYVEKDSPAEAAGLQVHDILQRLDDQLLVNPQQLAVLVRMKKPGDTVACTLLRGGKSTTLSAKLVERDLPPLESLQEPGIFTNPRPMPLNPMPGDGGLAPHASNMSVHRHDDKSVTRTLIDDDHDIALSTGRDGQSTLVVKDRAGHVLYRGPAAEAVLPPDVQAKVDRLQKQSSIVTMRSGGADLAASSLQLTRVDGDHQITLRIDEKGRSLTVKNKDGKTLYDGPYAGDEDLKTMPPDVAAKVQALAAKAADKPVHEGVHDATPPKGPGR